LNITSRSLGVIQRFGLGLAVLGTDRRRAREVPPEIGEEEPEDVAEAGELFDPGTTGRVIVMQNVVPVLSTIGAYAAFRVAFAFWW